MSSIKGGEYPLSKIFSSEFNYNIPSYQRPYSWTIQEAGILFDDLYDFYKNEDALATDVLNYDEWTTDIVKARQTKLIDAYKKGWDLEETKVDAVVDNAAVQVIKTISENDIRARILRIPAKIKERISESMTSYTVTFNGETVKELTIAKERDYFAKVTDLYKKYGLIEADGSFVPKQITWSMDEDGTLSATIK